MSTAASTKAASSKPPDPPKRALFSKPSWSNPKKFKHTDDLFNRSNQSYVGAAEERARRRERKLAKKQKEQTSDHPSDHRVGKRLRLSDDDSEDDDAGGFDSEDSSNARNKKLDADVHRRKHSTSSKESPSQPLQPKAQIQPARYNEDANLAKPIPLAGSLLKTYHDNFAVGTGEPEIQVTGEIRKPQLENGGRSSEILEIQDEEDELDGFPESDDDYPELAIKARDNARRNKLETEFSIGSLDIPSTAGDDAPLQQFHPIPKPKPPPPPPRDPVIKIFINSKIENTQPLIVNRRISQRLRDVRLAWCHRQNFSKEFTDKVFLTWRGCKLWDVTTCVRLGIAVDEFDNILLKGQKDITGEEATHIHMEAMTEEILEEYKKSHKAPILNEPIPGEDDVLVEDEKVEKPAQIKITLKAKGYKDFTMAIGASSPISTMVNAFRKEHKLASNKKTVLTFDGEKLDPHTKVQDTEISDLDFVEVYIK